ncbi:hypothetical protein EUZ85_30575 [Hahella sp. KA22]|uniref:PepSY domain-containing protein n=1 Tax=Hahella chejuensis (strain KCTC 2396) TaxID=349521 RepID=Q2S8G8_HAHCH|nr:MULTISPECIES: hypothetical protein [Hahella]ABC33056.1 hypothetical protein HCH_06411 [Hahella chejuensis KCTC 2396]AZZ94828.1 hypothetical protein ENC22_27990 [Hahella sp. KA22]MBU6952706.1 hypothetical protein [Hahella sp. HN01]MDG9667045.1 hypothetical protein [Hahella sp. CR1]QAY58202.1 hypothetical protein EUZ85_30575 [Hahella sp. KA22]
MTRTLLLTSILLTAWLHTPAALAAPAFGYSPSQADTLLLADVSEQDAASLVRQVSGGRVLKVESQGDVYRVKVLLPNGVVKTYVVERSSGRVS